MKNLKYLHINVRFLFAWYDMWMGVFWDRKNKWLYIFPIPMFGIVIEFYCEYWNNPMFSQWLQTTPLNINLYTRRRLYEIFKAQKGYV